MSTTTTGGQVPVTAQQPSHSFANIIDHPGSSWAGGGIALLTIGQAISAQSFPTTATGWITFIAQLALALAAALGK